MKARYAPRFRGVAGSLLGSLAALALGSCAQAHQIGTFCEPPGTEREGPKGAASVLHPVDVAPKKLDDGWPVSSLKVEGLDPGKIDDMLRAVAAGEYTKVDSILIARNGKLILEAYFNGFDRETKHDTRSVFKSFTSALVGIALDKGLIDDIDRPISDFFPDYWPSVRNDVDKKSRITLAHLLTMTPGFDVEENWGIGPYREDEMNRSDDWYRFTLDLPMAWEPGTRYSYNTPTSVLLGGVIAHAAGEPVPAFAKTHLFEPLGITDYCWTLTPKGRAMTGGNFFIRPRDMLKFGQLFLDRGVWHGRRVVSEPWVRESTRRHLAAARPDPARDEPSQLGYGYHWWTFRARDPQFDQYFASGNGGQKIFVFPGFDLVVVFTSSHYGKTIGHTQPTQMFKRFIIPALGY